MEHRCAARIQGELKVLIYKHQEPVAIGRIKNGSQLGVFVETDFADTECEHQLKLAVLPSKHAPATEGIEMNAMVIHKTSTGFGAEIEFYVAQQAELFIDMLQAKHTEPKLIESDHIEPVNMDSVEPESAPEPALAMVS